MIKRNNRLRNVPALNTASLPDLIFTVLFFFMIVTHMRTSAPLVKYKVPQGTELTRLAKKSSLCYIYIGRATDKNAHAQSINGYTIQLNNKYVSPTDISDLIAEEKKRMSPVDKMRMTVSIKADRSTPMAIINQVKRAIKRGGAMRINYAAEDASDNLKQK